MKESNDTDSLDEAIAWLLIQADEGSAVSLADATARYPEFQTELRRFYGQTERISEFAAAITNRDLPSQFAHYDLHDLLGRGSFGEVHKAWDTKLWRVVALKVPRFLDADESSKRRFLHEARSSSQLSHPNIVQTFEIGNHDSTPYIACEYVEGTTLHEWRRKTPTPHSAAKMALGVAEGLAHAHKNGVIHRDLNPRNVLVDLKETPRILDFGLAKHVNDSETISINGDVLGTPNYVSPEQIDGEGHNVDGRTDVYALGVILYELLTGKRPFDGDMKLLMHRVLNETPARPSELNPDVPSRLCDICMKCLEKNPDDRFATADAVCNALKRFINGDAPLADMTSVADTNNAPKESASPIWQAVALLAIFGLGAAAAFSFRPGAKIGNPGVEAEVDSTVVDEATSPVVPAVDETTSP